MIQKDAFFLPSATFVAQAHCTDNRLYVQAESDYEEYWAGQAASLDWFVPWHTVLDWQPPYCKWFVGGAINITYNCLEKQINAGRAHHTAFLWEGEHGEQKKISYRELLLAVSRCANVLKSLGVCKGDRVAIYMPMIIESIVAMLACARIGAVHSVVFGGFSAQALADRINDAQCSVVITADGGYRRGVVIPLKQQVDSALLHVSSVMHVIVFNHLSMQLSEQYCVMNSTHDYWYHERASTVDDICDPVAMDSEDILFILYTSGTTGKPKGIVHTVGGYAVGAYSTCKYVFDMQEQDVFWCTADVGWITGHTYVAYGPLMHGVTQLIYEGTPDYPEKNRFWELIEKYKVTIFYTAPTAIRLFSKWGEHVLKKHDLSTLRLIGSVGEPLNPEAWRWYYEHVGNSNCPIVDTWWQTETGSHMITTLPGVEAMRPGYVGRPLPGIAVAVFDHEGNELQGESGFLVVTKPWPSMMRTIWGDDDRFRRTYFRHNNYSIYYAGDGAIKDKNGLFVISGRIDDVLSVAGHRIGTMEIESALVDHPAVAEVAVIGKYDPIRGQAIVAFVSCKINALLHSDIIQELKNHVVMQIGAFARPQDIILVHDLPKTRSGKIMRRLLRDIAEGRPIGDSTTLADISIIEKIQLQYEHRL